MRFTHLKSLPLIKARMTDRTTIEKQHPNLTMYAMLTSYVFIWQWLE